MTLCLARTGVQRQGIYQRDVWINKKQTEGAMRTQPELSEREGWIGNVWSFWRRSCEEGNEAWVRESVYPLLLAAASWMATPTPQRQRQDANGV